MFKSLLLVSILCCFKAYGQESSASYNDLLLRIEKLEKLQQYPHERQNHVNSFLRNKINLGGFFESAFLYLNGPDTSSQANNTSNIIGINLGAEFSPKLKFVSQTLIGLAYPLLNEHNDPNAPTLALPSNREFKTFLYGSLIAQGYLEYALSRYVQVQVGMGYTPFGYALQQREPTLIIHRGNSQFIKTAKLAYPLWGGVHILGDLPVLGDPWGYNFYTFSSYYKPGDPGIGARLWHSMYNRRLTLGLSSQHAKDETDKYTVLGTDVRYQFQSFVFTIEYARSFMESLADPWSAYVEFDYHLIRDEFILYTLLSIADSTENQTGLGATALDDPFQKSEYSMGMNWLPTSFTRYRVGVTYHDYRGASAIKINQNRDYIAVDLSIGVAF